MNKYFAISGDSQLNDQGLKIISKSVQALARRGYHCRASSLYGTPSIGIKAFSTVNSENKLIYIGSYQKEEGKNKLDPCYRVYDETWTFKVASNFCSVWNSLPDHRHEELARNVVMLLGEWPKNGIKNPSEFLICWYSTKELNGISQVPVAIAKYYGIPVYNLFNNNEKNAFINKYLK